MASNNLLLDAAVRALGDDRVAKPRTRLPVLVLDEFLARSELERLVEWTLERRDGFRPSRVIDPDGEGGKLDRQTRRSRVLSQVAPWDRLLAERIGAVFDHVLERIGMERFVVRGLETQVTATNDGEFFRVHTDNTNAVLAGRRLTYVYFFCREPAPFNGGSLRVYETRKLANGGSARGGADVVVRPSQNRIVFFPSSMLHEVEEVRCSSRAFEDSRFTANGWLHAS
jgi:hypothetical protein